MIEEHYDYISPTLEYNTRYDFSEFGVYGQAFTYGVSIGYDIDKGISVAVFQQVSGGIAAFWSKGIEISFNGIEYSDVNLALGIAPPTLAPIPVTGGVFYDPVNEQYISQIGISLTSDYIEGGMYFNINYNNPPGSYDNGFGGSPERPSYGSGARNLHPDYRNPPSDNDGYRGEDYHAGEQEAADNWRRRQERDEIRQPGTYDNGFGGSPETGGRRPGNDGSPSHYYNLKLVA